MSIGLLFTGCHHITFLADIVKLYIEVWLLDESPFLLLLASSFFNLRSLGNHTEVFEELIGFIRFLGQKVTDFINFFSNIIEARKARFPFENVNVDL